MDKFAQERGFFNKMREKMNMPGSYLDRFFKPELERIMGALRVVDDKIRAELSGKTIEGQAPEIEKSAKDLIKDARRNFARREYMTGAADLGMFHKKMALIAAEINKWEVDVNRIHHRFLFQGTDEEKINKFREYMESKKAQEINRLVKQAGVMDFFYNLVSPRGRALAAWEKRYPKQTKELREGGPKMVDAAESLLNNTLSLLKEMATARAVRRPDDYMDAANKIVAEYNKFDAGDKGFRAFYQKAILPFMQIKEKVEEKLKTEKPEAEQVAYKAPQKMELGYQVEGPKEEQAPAPPAPPAAPGAPATPPTIPDLETPPAKTTQMQLPFGAQPPGASPPFAPPAKPEAAPGEITEKQSSRHENFLVALTKMGNEDPRILSSFISNYAKSIQDTDLETAIKLFSIVKRLRG